MSASYPAEVPPELLSRVQHLLGKRTTGWRRATGGYSPAQRWLLTLDDGTSCFLKAGSVESSAVALRDEYAKVYSRLEAPFLPRLLAWDDDGETPILLLEDLSHAFWPPPWAQEQVEMVLETLAAVRGLDLPGLPSILEREGLALYAGWTEVARDAAPFLSLDLCTHAWLAIALPVLEMATRSAVLVGDAILHFDIRSDNLCFDRDRVVLVDWNIACRGAGDLDVAFWLPSLESEGGPAPETILPDAPEYAALVAGFFASRAGLPVIPEAPQVRNVQLSQLKMALPWAIRALGLPPLDGPRSR
jgi:hypothetical protein